MKKEDRKAYRRGVVPKWARTLSGELLRHLGYQEVSIQFEENRKQEGSWYVKVVCYYGGFKESVLKLQRIVRKYEWTIGAHHDGLLMTIWNPKDGH